MERDNWKHFLLQCALLPGNFSIKPRAQRFQAITPRLRVAESVASTQIVHIDDDVYCRAACRVTAKTDKLCWGYKKCCAQLTRYCWGHVSSTSSGIHTHAHLSLV